MLEVITSYKNHVSFPPFISSLVSPLQAALLALPVISQICYLGLAAPHLLSYQFPGTPRTPLTLLLSRAPPPFL